MNENDWRKVFEIRCRSKLGQVVLAEELKLIKQAVREDADRYKALDEDVFYATAPFGSSLPR